MGNCFACDCIYKFSGPGLVDLRNFPFQGCIGLYGLARIDLVLALEEQ